MSGKLLGQGAEAVITLEQPKEGPRVIKDRVKKRYRHPALDEHLRTQRTKFEERLLKKAGTIIDVPRVLDSEGTMLNLEYVEGPLVKELLDDAPELTRTIGRMLALIHAKNIIHGDLTTSNMIVRKMDDSQKRYPDLEVVSFLDDLLPSRISSSGPPGEGHERKQSVSLRLPRPSGRGGGHSEKIFFIDFGLAFTSTRVEDKAVDIHLFKQALESRHYRVCEQAYRQFLKGYREAYDSVDKTKECQLILERLKAVEARGRNKAKF